MIVHAPDSTRRCPSPRYNVGNWSPPVFKFTLRSLLATATITPPVLAGIYLFVRSLEPIGAVILLVIISFFVATWLPVLILSTFAPRLRSDRHP
jgi:hypothetical protein